MVWFRSDRRVQRRTHLHLEELGGRIVPATLSGNAWPSSQLVTISFVPDGTLVGNDNNGYIASNLFATLNAKFGSPAVWEGIILKAAQSWAQQTNLNFALVADDGANIGSGAYQQGSPTHGDIRISGYNFGTGSTIATAYMPPPINNQDLAGEIKFNTGVTFNNGSTYDLFSVAAHELGHSLGLLHTNITPAVQYGAYAGVKSVLNADDIGGIRQIYSGGAARSADGYDAAASNGTVATATDLTSLVDPSAYTAVVTGLDVTSTSDVDYYKIGGAVPTSTGQLTVTVQSTGLSLLSPTLTVYAANGTTVLGTATGGSGTTGATLSVTVSGVGAGSAVYVKVAGAVSTPFGTGSYALTLNTGTNPTPAVPLPNTSLLNDPNPSAGGGTALTAGPDDPDSENPASDDLKAFGDTPEETAALIAYLTANGLDLYGYGVGRITPAPAEAIVPVAAAPAAVGPVGVPAAAPAVATVALDRAVDAMALWMTPAGLTLQTATATPAAADRTDAPAKPLTTGTPAAADFHYDGWFYAAADESAATADDAWDEGAPDMVVTDGSAADAGEWDAHAAVYVG